MSNDSTNLASAEQVARYLLHLAAQGEAVPLTQMHVHKLVYYVQLASLGARGRVMFSETIEAWRHGPVVPALYPTFRTYTNRAIPTDEARDGSDLRPDDRDVVESVWCRMKRYSAKGLRDKTHREAPWTAARGALREGERGRTEISVESMRSYVAFEQKTWCEKRGINPAELAESLAQARRGEVVNVNLAARLA